MAVGLAQSMPYGNTKVAGRRILEEGNLRRIRAFAELWPHDLSGGRFSRPGKRDNEGEV